MQDKPTNELLNKVYAKVLNFLSFKPRTQVEIEQKIDRILLKYKDSADTQSYIKQEIINLLIEERLINDERYAKDYLDVLYNSRKLKSVGEVKRFLRKKGISDVLVNKALDSYDLDALEKEAISKLISKKKDTYKNANHLNRKAKLTRYLVNKGFKFYNVQAVIDSQLGVK